MNGACDRCREPRGDVFFVLRASVATSSPEGARLAAAYLGVVPGAPAAELIEARPGPVGDLPGMHWAESVLCPSCFAHVAPLELAPQRAARERSVA